MARIKYYDSVAQEWAYADMAVAMPPSRLPSAYQEVEYIANDGTGQYIDTGIAPSDDCKMIFDIALDLPVLGSGLFIGGSRENGSSKMFVVMMQDNTSSKCSIAAKASTNADFFVKQISNKSCASAVTVLPRTTLELAINGGDYVNSVVCGEQKSGTITAFSSSYNVYLFGINNGGTLSQQTGKILYYGFKAYTGTTLSIDLIPCYRKADSVIGMYDIVNDVFYTNDGTGTFTKGADV